MSLYSSEVPLHEVYDVEFDEPLDLLLSGLDDATYGRIERFWTSLYMYQCPPEVRATIDEMVVMIESIQIIPVTYDLHEQSLRVLMQPIWRYGEKNGEVCTGYCRFVTLSADGTLWFEIGDKKVSYSDAMRPHVGQLLANTALSMPPLEADSVYWRDEGSNFNGDSL